MAYLPYEELERYFDEVPEWVHGAQKSSITICVGDIITDEPQTLKITAADVAEYYDEQAGNISSGMRCIAGYHGDWRGIDHIAQMAWGWIKHINKPLLKRELRKRGLRMRE